MDWPPHTLGQLHRRLGGPPWLRRLIGCAWMGVGVFAMLMVLALAIACLGYGVPFRDTETGQPIGTLRLLWILLLGLGGAVFWLGAGILLYRSALRRESAG